MTNFFDDLMDMLNFGVFESVTSDGEHSREKYCYGKYNNGRVVETIKEEKKDGELCYKEHKKADENGNLIPVEGCCVEHKCCGGNKTKHSVEEKGVASNKTSDKIIDAADKKIKELSDRIKLLEKTVKEQDDAIKHYKHKLWKCYSDALWNLKEIAEKSNAVVKQIYDEVNELKISKNK